MFEVRNKCNTTISKHRTLSAAKLQADKLCDQFQHYTVYEVKDVYTTSTLEEALKD